VNRCTESLQVLVGNRRSFGQRVGQVAAARGLFV
jgi:hypothetical protein